MDLDEKVALALNRELNHPSSRAKVRLINKRQSTFPDQSATETGSSVGESRSPILDEMKRLDSEVASYEQEQEDRISGDSLQSTQPSQVSSSTTSFNVRLLQ
jgi:hypothetical protein